ncbi:tail fiber domain-containing protein [Pseudomonas putida]|uniref:tail fiber domain-containing protein n=1 Tax=Pseudomonas putida TaxID=303 RepID=UPI0004295CD1|nr:tail fiber domain-containing protein [Pseudomonas putida]
MAYNSAHTGPEIDAAVQLLGQIQEARDSTSQDLSKVKDLASQVKVDAAQVADQTEAVTSKASQVSQDAAVVEQARQEVVGAAATANEAMDAASLSAASALESQNAASISEQAAASSQLAAGLSELVSAESASEAKAAADQVADDRKSAAESAASAAASAQNAEAVVTGGTASVTPGPGLIPLADAGGRIEEDWLPPGIARAESVQAALEVAEEASNTAAEAQARSASFVLPSPEAPVVRDDGAPLQVGDRYFNSVEQAEFIYKSAGWALNDSLQAIADLKNQSDPQKGAAEVGWDGAPVSDQLALSKKLANYSALRNYSGLASRVEITQPTLAGSFTKRPFTQGDVDNGGTRILSGNGLWTWERVFQGSVMSTWFQVVPGDSSNRYTAQLQSAINHTSASFNGTLEVVGDVYLDATISVPSTSKYNLDFTRAKLIYDSSVTVGVTFGTPGANPYRGTVSGLRMTKPSRGTGDIGFKLVNVAESDFIACGSENFAKAFAPVPSGNSRVAYNRFHDPVVSNHEYGFWAKPEDAGSYVNGNTVDGGRFGSFVAGRLIDHVYLDNELGSGVQHNKFDKLSIEGFSGSGACGRTAVRCVNGANQNVVEWCRTEKYNDGWSDATYFFGEGTLGNTVLDTRSDLTIIDNGSNNWWTPITGFHFNGFQSNQAAMPAFKYTRSAPLSNVATKFAIDIADTYAASGEVGLLKYTSARGGGTLIDITTSLGSMRMNGACEWTTPSRRSGPVSGPSAHGYSVAASVSGAILCAAYHSLKSNEAGNWFLYGEGNAPSYFGGPIRTVGANNITPATAYTGALLFSNTSSNTGGVASEYQTNNVATRHHVAFSNPNGVVGSISTNANSTAYNTSSDRDKKKNIKDASDSGQDIDGIRVAQFDWKSNGEHQAYGFIAQELVKVAPYAVSHDPEDPESDWSVDYSKLVPILMKEIQSLRARVKKLEE